MFFQTSQKLTNKIIFLISTSRSNSTIFLRMMHNRGDMDVFMEPGFCMRFMGPEFRIVDNNNNKINNFDDLISYVEDLSTTRNVFIKELSIAAKDYLTPDSSLLSNNNVYFFFLLRDPKNSLISQYKKRPISLNATDKAIVSYQDEWNLYRSIGEQAKERTFLMSSEDLLNNPSVYVKRFCEQAGIVFSTEQLHWDKLEPIYEDDCWHLSKNCMFSKHWQDNALRSTCFDNTLVSKVKTDERGEPTFEELDQQHRAAYRTFYKEQMVYYQLLLKEYENSQRSEHLTQP